MQYFWFLLLFFKVKEAISTLLILMETKRTNDQLFLKLYEADAAILLYQMLLRNESPIANGSLVPSYVKEAILKVCNVTTEI